ncbi:hypothetical protein AGLY_014315, partial [Aphis glycines]
ANNNSKDFPIVGGIKFRLVYEIKCDPVSLIIIIFNLQKFSNNFCSLVLSLVQNNANHAYSLSRLKAVLYIRGKNISLNVFAVDLSYIIGKNMIFYGSNDEHLRWNSMCIYVLLSKGNQLFNDLNSFIGVTAAYCSFVLLIYDHTVKDVPLTIEELFNFTANMMIPKRHNESLLRTYKFFLTYYSLLVLSNCCYGLNPLRRYT